ncbi:hypothetical protein F5887DRAFT_925577 [Amanita rubescens]|nr:hypothetical protein F5887DRAFT_926010 [Amanita rubescens]KAF8326131.1 hypothetical protein F5887DRAFT_925577 [Amanita rubescens]
MALAELFMLSQDRIIPVHEAVEHVLLRRAFEDPIGAPAIFFSSPRDGYQHANIRQELFNILLIGHHKPWTHPHFKAFTRGLRLGLCNVPVFVKHPTEVEIKEDIYLFGIQLVLTLWNNHITCPDDITRRLRYLLFNPLQQPEVMLFAKLFRTRFARWLRGKGHPQELVGSIVPTDMYEKSLRSLKTTRAAIFWKAISNLDVLPAHGRSWDMMRKMPGVIPQGVDQESLWSPAHSWFKAKKYTNHLKTSSAPINTNTITTTIIITIHLWPTFFLL